MKTKISIIVLVLVIAGAFMYRNYRPVPLADVPLSTDEPAWFTAENTTASFQFPESLGLTYVELVDWPPVLQVLPQAQGCTEAGSAIERAGRTEERTINGRNYCATEVKEGAAGSVYTSYAYAFPKGAGTAIFTFSTRAVQCGNYDETEKNACEIEQANLNLDDIVDRIAQTLQLK